jgi:phosphoribosylanthranilate isomerase
VTVCRPSSADPCGFRNRIQIAGVRNAAEAEMLVAAGVHWLGFPLRLAVHEPDLTEAEAAAVIRQLPATVIAVAITYVQTATDALDLCRSTGAQGVQLHGPIPVTEAAHLRELAPHLLILKSVIVRSSHAGGAAALVAEAGAYAPFVDAFIADTFDPLTGASGATGKTHDWRVSRALVRTLPRPVILAGGLTPENVRDAVRQVQPAGVDSHTGVEDRNGAKDPEQVRRFVAAARAGFADVNLLTEPGCRDNRTGYTKRS